MITARREGTLVVVRIDVAVPDLGVRSFPFKFEAAQAEYAGFIKDAIQKALADLDQQAYNVGRDDMKQEVDSKIRRIERKLKKATQK